MVPCQAACQASRLNGTALVSAALAGGLAKGVKTMLLDYLPVLLFIVLGAAFVPLNLLIGSLIRPRIYEPEKYTPYECGEESEGHLFNQFNPRFYIIALIFVIFEVELVFLFPWAVLLRRLGWYGFAVGFIFLVILLLSLVYEWGKGNLEWVMPPRGPTSEATDRPQALERVAP
jgi:NADH-quinone oxidoreductase subunit A